MSRSNIVVYNYNNGSLSCVNNCHIYTPSQANIPLVIFCHYYFSGLHQKNDMYILYIDFYNSYVKCHQRQCNVGPVLPIFDDDDYD